MGFQTKLSFVRLSNHARVLTVRDATGFFSEQNISGYGDPNPDDFESIAFTANVFGSSVKKQLVQSIDYPVHTLPTIEEIIEGDFIYLDSFSLGISEEEDGTVPFRDGILEINMIHKLFPLFVNGQRGDNFVTGVNLTRLRNYDYITAGNKVYRIDRVNHGNSETVIFLTEPLEDYCTQVNQTIIADLKILVTAGADEMIAEYATKIASDKCDIENSCGKNDIDVEIISKVMVYKLAADSAFDNLDFKKAHELTRGAFLELKNLLGC